MFERNAASIHGPSSFKDGTSHDYIRCVTIKRGIYPLIYLAETKIYLNARAHIKLYGEAHVASLIFEAFFTVFTELF